MTRPVTRNPAEPPAAWPFVRLPHDPNAIVIVNPALRRVLAERKKEQAA